VGKLIFKNGEREHRVIADEFGSDFVVFLLHQAQAQRSSVTDLIISVVEAT